MLFHVTFTVRDSFPLSEIATVQNRISDTIQKVMQTGKVRDSGTFLGDRKGFFVIECDSAEELFALFAPMYDVAKPDVQAIIPFEVLPKIFEKLQKLPQ
jgi:muconolactone delta-isomerase